MDLDRIKEILQEWPIRYDKPHFERKAQERNRDAAYLVKQLKDGNIQGVMKNPNPSDFVPYDRALMVKVPKSSRYHYRIATYLKENREVFLKTVFKGSNTVQDEWDDDNLRL